MTTPIIFCGDSIDQGSKPTFIFPLLASSLHVDLTMRDPFNLVDDLVLTESGFISATFPATGTGIHLTGTDLLGVVDVADYPTSLAGINMRYSGTGTVAGRAIGDPVPTEEAIAGQLANLGVKYSQGGNALIPAIGMLAEIGEGLYKYTLDSTETQQPGTNLIRIQPINALAVPNAWLTDIYLGYRVAKPGIPITTPTPGSTTIIDPQSMEQLQNFIMQQTSTVLNAMQTKPTFRRDP